MNFFKVDTVQIIALAGSALAVTASMLTNYANDKKMDETIERKVAEAIARQLAAMNQNE